MSVKRQRSLTDFAERVSQCVDSISCQKTAQKKSTQPAQQQQSSRITVLTFSSTSAVVLAPPVVQGLGAGACQHDVNADTRLKMHGAKAEAQCIHLSKLRC